MKQEIYNHISNAKTTAHKAFAVLIDPDKLDEKSLHSTIELAMAAQVDYFFVGGSLVVTDTLDKVVSTIKK